MSIVEPVVTKQNNGQGQTSGDTGELPGTVLMASKQVGRPQAWRCVWMP